VFANSAFSEVPLSTLTGSLFGSSVAEVLALNEQLSNLASLNPLVSENSSLLDAPFPVGSYAQTVFDQASVSQLRQLGGGFSAGSISSGPFSGLGDELSVISGDLFFAQATVNSSTTDSASVLDSAFTTAQMSDFLVVEAASGLDNSIGNIEFNRTFSDAATQADFILGNPAFSTSVTDAASGIEDVSSIPTYPATFTDAGSMAGVVSSLATVISTAQEAVVIQDVVPTNIVGNSTVINSASYTDFVTSSVVFQTNIVTSVHTLDQFSARLQWEPVPTDSPTVWTLINVFS
jgi:hypothetical protein